MFYNILIVHVNILGLLLKILIENFLVVKYKEWFFIFYFFKFFSKIIFEIFINNTIFCDILVWKCCFFKFIVKNLDRNFFAY